MENTKVEWASHSWSPWIGCSKSHVGCNNCYAEAMGKRLGVKWGPKGTRRRTSEAYWKEPLTWDRKAKENGERPRVFSSLCDPFEDWGGPIEWGSIELKGDPVLRHVQDGVPIWETMDHVRCDWFQLIDKTSNLDWLVLTKRPGNVRRMWPPRKSPIRPHIKRENVWLGVSVSNQETADKLIPELLKLRDLSPCLFVSVEPLIGPATLSGCMESLGSEWVEHHYCGPSGGSMLGWIIVGGESGPRARPCNID